MNQRMEVRMQNAHMNDEGDMIVSGYVNETETLSQELGKEPYPKPQEILIS